MTRGSVHAPCTLEWAMCVCDIMFLCVPMFVVCVGAACTLMHLGMHLCCHVDKLTSGLWGRKRSTYRAIAGHGTTQVAVLPCTTQHTTRGSMASALPTPPTHHHSPSTGHREGGGGQPNAQPRTEVPTHTHPPMHTPAHIINTSSIHAHHPQPPTPHTRTHNRVNYAIVV